MNSAYLRSIFTIAPPASVHPRLDFGALSFLHQTPVVAVDGLGEAFESKEERSTTLWFL